MPINNKRKFINSNQNKGSAPPIDQINLLIHHYQTEKYSEALKLAESITSKFPNHPFCFKILNGIFSQINNYPSALTAIQKAVKLDSKDAENYNLFAVTLKKMNRLEEAVSNYKKAITIKPNHAIFHYNLGNALKDMNKLLEAEESYRNALVLKPELNNALLNLGNTLQDLGNHDEAKLIYERAIALNPNSHELHNSLGNTKRNLGLLDDAVISYLRAIELQFDYADAHCNLGTTLRLLGRLEESEISLRKAIVFNTNFAEAFSQLGFTLQELKKIDEAITLFKHSLILKPDHDQGHYNLATLFFELGKFEEASHIYKKIHFEFSQSYYLYCLFLLDKKELFNDQLCYLTETKETNSIIGSLCDRAEIKYGGKNMNLFCNNPIDYCRHTSIINSCDFDNVFIRTANSILNDNTLSVRKQILLKNGKQTYGNLFDSKPDLTNNIKSVIYTEVNNYKEFFKNSGQGFIENWPSEFKIDCWLISIKKGGELQPHMHANGWVSGSIYINVPPKINIDDGNLVVMTDVIKNGNGTSKSINVITGSICIFPSSLYHYTVPFDSNEDRIVFAFDIIKIK